MTKAEAREDAPIRTRDRDGTARAIVIAAREVLAEDGFQSFGVNAIARRAGCDKQLIYRYFGGLEGIADAIGELLGKEIKDALDHLPTAEAPPPASYAELMERQVLGLLELLRRSPLMRQINAWEVAAPSPLVSRLVVARSRQLLSWSKELRGTLPPPPGMDVSATNVVLFAAVQQLVLSAAAVGDYGAVPLRTEDDWDRMKKTLIRIVATLYREA